MSLYLSARDLVADRTRVLTTGVGLGLLFTVVLAMGGIYRGMVEDAVAQSALYRPTAPDEALWVVEADTHGPFAAPSRVDRSWNERLAGVPRVKRVQAVRSAALTMHVAGRTQPLLLVAVSVDPNAPPAGLERAEIPGIGAGDAILDRSANVPIGTRLTLGSDEVVVRGLSTGRLAPTGDPLLFLGDSDFRKLSRAGNAASLRERRSVSGGDSVSAFVVTSATRDLPLVQAALRKQPSIRVAGDEEQRTWMLEGAVDKARKQIGLFRAILAIVSSVILTLIVQQMVSSQQKEIALFKIMGARNLALFRFIFIKSAALVSLGSAFAWGAAQVAFPRFPRRVIVGSMDYILLVVAALILAALATLVAYRKAMNIEASTLLAT